MLPITPSDFHYFVDKWTEKLNKISDKNEKNVYAQKISNQLWDFANSDADNTLAPYVEKWCDKASHKDMNVGTLLKGLDQLRKDDNKIIL